jgi:hypothetical protein
VAYRFATKKSAGSKPALCYYIEVEFTAARISS